MDEQLSAQDLADYVMGFLPPADRIALHARIRAACADSGDPNGPALAALLEQGHKNWYNVPIERAHEA